MTVHAAQPQEIPLTDLFAPRVELLHEDDSAQSVTIACRRVVTLVGSKPGCKVLLRHKSVAPVHVALLNDGYRLIAVNLQQPETFLVDRNPTHQAAIANGQTISIGPMAFEVSIFRKLMRDSDHLFLDQHEPDPSICMLEHLASSRMVHLKNNVCVLGRSELCDIRMTDQRLSRVHAIVFRYQGKPVIVDLMSENHTFVNGARVAFSPLVPGDVIEIGESQFRVHPPHHTTGLRSVAPQTMPQQASANGNGNGHANGQGDHHCPEGPGFAARMAPQGEGSTISGVANGHHGDLIDIHATESKSNWSILDRYQPANGKK